MTVEPPPEDPEDDMIDESMMVRARAMAAEVKEFSGLSLSKIGDLGVQMIGS